MKTYATKDKDIKRDWYLIDARGKTLGRLAAKVASILKGKHKPMYVPYLDVGDYCVVVNAKYVTVTGRKLKEKTYDRYSGYPSGRREVTLEKMHEKKPIFALSNAVKGMLPKNSLGRKMFKKLKVYPEAQHENKAQAPKTISL